MDWLDIKEFIKDSIVFILVAVGMFLFILYVTVFTQINGPSMLPNLKENDVVVIFKLSKKFSKDDLIVFEYQGTNNLIKRVIGLPGDIVEIKSNKLYINDELVEEPYVLEKNNTNEFNKVFDKIPEDQYLVLGDNRDDSLDSRTFGFVKKSSIKGKVLFRIWPINKIGTVK